MSTNGVGGRNAVGIVPGGIGSFSSIAVEIEFHGDAGRDATRASNGVRAVAQAAAAWSERCRRAAAMYGEGETIGVGIGELKRKVSGERLNIHRCGHKTAAGFGCAAVRQAQA